MKKLERKLNQAQILTLARIWRHSPTVLPPYTQLPIVQKLQAWGLVECDESKGKHTLYWLSESGRFHLDYYTANTKSKTLLEALHK